MTSQLRLQRAAQIVFQGGVIAYPTEAVWGLGCDPWNEQAVLELLAIKRRPIEKGVILIASSIEQFDFLLKYLSPAHQRQLIESWPGPFTWLVPHFDLIPYWITGEHESVALRVSAHPLVKALCQQTGPLVSTSANPAGLPAAKSRLIVERYFHGQLDAVVDGRLGDSKKPSQITDLMSGQIIR